MPYRTGQATLGVDTRMGGWAEPNARFSQLPCPYQDFEEEVFTRMQDNFWKANQNSVNSKDETRMLGGLTALIESFRQVRQSIFCLYRQLNFVTFLSKIKLKILEEDHLSQ